MTLSGRLEAGAGSRPRRLACGLATLQPKMTVLRVIGDAEAGGFGRRGPPAGACRYRLASGRRCLMHIRFD